VSRSTQVRQIGVTPLLLQPVDAIIAFDPAQLGSNGAGELIAGQHRGRQRQDLTARNKAIALAFR
jgi:hypothetical protein